MRSEGFYMLLIVSVLINPLPLRITAQPDNLNTLPFLIGTKMEYEISESNNGVDFASYDLGYELISTGPDFSTPDLSAVDTGLYYDQIIGSDSRYLKFEIYYPPTPDTNNYTIDFNPFVPGSILVKPEWNYFSNFGSILNFTNWGVNVYDLYDVKYQFKHRPDTVDIQIDSISNLYLNITDKNNTEHIFTDYRHEYINFQYETISGMLLSQQYINKHYMLENVNISHNHNRKDSWMVKNNSSMPLIISAYEYYQTASLSRIMISEINQAEITKFRTDFYIPYYVSAILILLVIIIDFILLIKKNRHEWGDISFKGKIDESSDEDDFI